MYTRMSNFAASLVLVATLALTMAAPSAVAQTTAPAGPTPSTTVQPEIAVPELIQLFFGVNVQVMPQAVPPDQLEGLYDEVFNYVENRYYDESKLTDWGKWKDAYKGKLLTLEDLDAALSAMLSSLNDPWTYYVSAAERERHSQKARAGIVSIGVEVKATDTGYVIDYLRAKTPAYGSALRKGDTLKSVNDREISQLPLSEVETLLEGKAGETLKLTYVQNGEEKTLTLAFQLRAEAHSEARVLPGKVLYLKLPAFDRASVQSLESAINKLREDAGFAFEYIVLDLRGNPGGDVDLAIHVVETMMGEGVVMTHEERTGRIAETVTRRVRPFLPHRGRDETGVPVCQTSLLHDKPLAVLIDNSSASSSEIVAAALNDNNRALLVGTTSWGKAVAYRTQQLPNGGGLSVTISGIRSPEGFDWSGKGIEPDIVVEQPHDSSVDLQLMRAVEALKEMGRQESR